MGYRVLSDDTTASPFSHDVTALGRGIIQAAMMWVDCSCRETMKNGGNCIDDLTMRYTTNRPWRVPYCAMAAWEWYWEGCQLGGFIPLLPRSSSAKGLLVAAANFGFDIDETPGMGSIFYRKSSIQGRRNGSEISGHCGVVTGWDDTHLYTAEANSGQQIRAVKTTWDRMRELKVQFIHCESRMQTSYDGPRPDLVPVPEHCQQLRAQK